MAESIIQMVMGAVEITSQVTWTEGKANAHVYALPQIRLVVFFYQGASTSHASGAELFTVPSNYKPLHNVYIPFVVNYSAYGSIGIDTSGVCTVNAISDPAFKGRIYASFVYPY